MKFIRLAILFLMCYSSAVFAQNPFSIRGSVADTASNSKLQNATVSILNAKDSTLYRFTRASATGSFAIPNMKKGNFILLLTYPEYADYVAHFSLDSVKNTFDFKQVNMKSKAKLLNEVIIKGQGAAIKIKGDTTEFNASSYTIQPNDKVEDLLKKIPGIQIDKDGKITAQGKTVPKVLVDGEEFFGDDPTLVTKNLRADMVDKIQLYDKSSDQAAFTGVDDGEKTKTINIKLKEDKKSGFFGKVDGGIGTNKFYQGQVMFNRFKAKQKFSLYGIGSNTGKVGLGWEDSNKYGLGSENVEFMEDGGMMIAYGGDDMDSWGGGYYGEGIPKALNGGAHYDTKWNDGKESINTNYKIGSLGVKGTKNTLSQNNLPTGIINSRNDEATDNSNFRQKLDAIYQLKIDSTSNLKVTIGGTLKNTDGDNTYATESQRGDGSLLNRSARKLSNDSKEQAFNASAFYTKKLKKTGRNFSVRLSQAFNQKDGEGYLNSKNEFFDDEGKPKSTELVDQFKTNNVKSSVFGTNLTYNEPLSKTISLVLNYGLSINNNRADKKSFNASAPNRYDILDPQFSNDFEANQLSNQGGAIFNYKGTKTSVNFGTRLSAVHFDQFEAYTNTSYKRNFTNWMPQFGYQYRFSGQRSLRFNYNGYTNQPTVEQLQPVKVNNDPLNIQLGNANLKPSYSNNFNLNYNSYKVLSNQSIYIGGRYAFTNNQIVNNTVTDTTSGKTEYQSTNLRGKTPTNYSLYIDAGQKIKALDMNVGVSMNFYGSTNFNYVNHQLNKTTSNQISASLNLYKSKEKKYDFQLYGGPTYNMQESSLQAKNSNGWGFSGNGSFTVYLPGKVQLRSDGNYQYSAKTQSFNQSFERLIINSSISKTFFKADNLKVTVSGNDLLNQNTGFDRSANGNMITQTNTTTIKRFFLFSVSWDFNKMGGVSN